MYHREQGLIEPSGRSPRAKATDVSARRGSRPAEEPTPSRSSRIMAPDDLNSKHSKALGLEEPGCRKTMAVEDPSSRGSRAMDEIGSRGSKVDEPLRSCSRGSRAVANEGSGSRVASHQQEPTEATPRVQADRPKSRGSHGAAEETRFNSSGKHAKEMKEL